MFCEKCGNSLPDGVMFCKRCGNKVERKSLMNESNPRATAAPQPVAPPPVAPQYNAPQYGTPMRPAPKKIPKANIILGTVGLLAGVAMFIVYLTNVHKIGNSEPANSNYGQQSNAAVDTPGGNTGGNAGGNTGGNAGGGGTTQPTTVQTQTYTSEKTGTVFTVPSEGYAQVATNGGSPKTVAAEFKSHEPTEYFNYDSAFIVYPDEPSAEYIRFCLTPKTGSWKTGAKLEHSELCVKGLKPQQSISIKCTVAYLGHILESLLSYDLPDYYKDSEFKIIEADSSGKAVKFYFYVEYRVSGSSSSPYYTYEGVANVIRDAGTGSSGGNTGGGTVTPPSATGETRCGVCLGKGKVSCPNCTNGYLQCPSCHGAQTYYDYAEKRDKVCPRCNGGGTIACTRSGCGGTGYIDCGSCGGDGYY